MFAFRVKPAVLLYAMMLASPGSAQQPAVRAVCPAIEPWGYQETEEGAACSFMDYVAREAGMAPKTEAWPVPRIMRGLRDGSLDLTVLVPSPERLDLAVEVCEPSTLAISVAYYRNSAAASPQAFAGTRVGTFRNGALLKEFFTHGAERVDLLNMTQGFKMLMAKRLAATVCVQPGCDRAMRNAGISPEELSVMPIETFPMALMLSRRSPLASDADTLERLGAACRSQGAHRILDGLIKEFE